MSIHIERMCGKCRRKFWLTTAEEAAYIRSSRPASPVHCPSCRVEDDGPANTRLPAKVKQEPPTHLVGRRETMVADLRGLLETAFAPIDPSPRTLGEWWDEFTGRDLVTKRLDEKHEACGQANKLVQQRTALMQNLKSMLVATGELEHVELETQRKLREARVELLKLDAEELQLEEEIAERQALREERLRTQELEEAKKQAKLLADLEPPPPPEPPEDPAQKAIADYREQVQTRSTAKQLVISDFLTAVRQVYDANLDDTEKVLRIRAVLEDYKQDFEALPYEVRCYVEWVEKREESR